jgi:hypothetical protein
MLSSLSVRRPRQFGACWLGSRLWQELKLDEFFGAALQDRHGTVEWAKVIELLAVNRLCDPESELVQRYIEFLVVRMRRSVSA